MSGEQEPARVDVPSSFAALYAEYQEAKGAVSAWSSRERMLKMRVLAAMNYRPDDEKPPSAVAVDVLTGDPVFRVVVSYTKRLNTEYLKTRHPAIYAECERNVPVRSIKPPE